MPFTVKVTRVYPEAHQGVFVQWTYTPETGVVGPHTFQLQRAGSPGGPWTNIGAPLVDAITAHDDLTPGTGDGTNLLSLTRALWYRVVGTDPDVRVATSMAVNLDGIAADDMFQLNRTGATIDKKKTYLRRKILRDERTAFRLNGVDLAVLKRRHAGTRCTVCYDSVTKLSIKTRCTACYSTGWSGGYYPPIMTIGRVTPEQIQTTLANEGKSELINAVIILLNYPLVEEGDVIVETDNKVRWIVKQTATTQLRRISVHQRIIVTSLPRTAPEFGIVI